MPVIGKKPDVLTVEKFNKCTLTIINVDFCRKLSITKRPRKMFFFVHQLIVDFQRETISDRFSFSV